MRHNRFPGTARREYFKQDREASLENMTGPQLKAIAELTKIFEDSSMRFNKSGKPYIFLQLPSEQGAEETDEMLHMIGIHSWIEGNEVKIEHVGEVHKMQLLGIFNDPLNEIPLEDSFPGQYKSIPEIFEKNDSQPVNNFGLDQETLSPGNEENNLSSDVRRVGRGEILSEAGNDSVQKIWHGDTSFLAKNSREYYWKGSRLFSRKEDREIELQEYADVLAKAKSGDRNAREQFLKMNAGLVYFVVFNFSRRKPSLNQADLIQEGLIAMDKAIDNFDVVRDVKFSTYAVLCIEGAMHNFHRDHKSDIRMPRFRFDTANEIKRAETLEFKGGGTNLEKRVAIRLGVSVDEMRWSKEEYNTDRAYVETEEADGVEDERETERALKEYFEHQTSEVIKKSFEALTPREKLVLVLRCGLDPDLFLKGEKLSQESSVDMFTEVTKYFGDRIFTREYSLKGIILEEVGKCLDVTRERIRQIEVKALRKLRHPMHSGPLREMLKDSES